ncbi:calcyclin binding protein-like, putative [Theileria annulata]|uniref:Calcyclin binding protein-like, putative n=1 Tax=Theileria annulata TaxID=5874 RepID=Q4UBE0_THEAN|nr:calcyclin binding protein-like, putative [Theileria annulata]CAI75861.1 calcyclin binding protein-like, putative [Theileria annulata]|eukprot:XP_955337.1 calcyclin binding protein-like, putative [Theileria annulata]
MEYVKDKELYDYKPPDTDLEEWRGLLNIATRPSVRTQIEHLISNLESTLNTSNNANNTSKVVYNTVTSFSWDQTQRNVTVLVPVSEEPKDVNVDVKPDSLDIKFVSGSKHYQLKLKNLFSKINTTSSWKWKSGYLQVKLEKENHVNWSSLTSSSDKEKKLLPQKTDESNPQAMLMDMMKNLYDQGDDEMKRTIAKAWVNV